MKCLPGISHLKKKKRKKIFEKCQLYFLHLYPLIFHKKKEKKIQDLHYIHMDLPLLLYLIIIRMLFK